MKKIMLVCAAMVALTAMTACKSGTREKAAAEPPFADTIPICFETDWGHTGAGGIFCSVEINGVKVDTVLVDNGCYRSDIDPDLAAKLDFTYRVYRTDTLRAKRGSEDLADIARYSVVTDSLCYKIGHTSFRLDTIDINKWAALMYSMPSLGATIGRDVFEKYVVEIDLQRHFMVLSNHLPASIGQYKAIPMEFTNQQGFPRFRCVQTDGFRLKDGAPCIARVFLDLGNAAGTAFDSAFLNRVDQHFSQIDTSSLAWLILSQIGSAVDSMDFPIGYMDDSRRTVAKLPGTRMDFAGLDCDILLGTDFFRHFNVIFDYKNNMLYLKHN